MKLETADEPTVVGRANDQIGALVTRFDEQRIDIGLTIRDHNQVCGWLDRLLRLGQGGEPALALTLGLRTLARFPTLALGAAWRAQTACCTKPSGTPARVAASAE